MREGTAFWKDAVGYCVYLRSFQDSNDDGVGDLDGLRRRLDHLVDLGIDIVWVTPFHPSPLADGGYDVADFLAVDPVYGGMPAFDRLVEAVHGVGLRLIMDVVPNHTSEQHPWFVAERSRPPSPDDRYVWADSSVDGGPPNNWVSQFGGSAWTYDDIRGQYFLHLFLPQQPDLDWRSGAVVDAFDHILHFWLDRGVDGFRIDAAQCLIKDQDLRSNPQHHAWSTNSPRDEQWAAFDHVHDIAQPESHDLFRRWRAICDAAGAFVVGETSMPTGREVAALMPGDGLHAGFWLPAARGCWNADDIRHMLAEPLRAVGDRSCIVWVSSTLDESRSVSRFGGGEIGRRRALAYTTAQMWLPGIPFLYQGQELGLEDGIIEPSQRLDPVGATAAESRDGCRTPMPWDERGASFGFSTADHTWLPVGGRRTEDTVAWQRDHSGSWLDRHMELIRVRRRHIGAAGGTVTWLTDVHADLVGFRRGPICVVLNAGERSVEFPAAAGQRVIFDSFASTAPPTPIRGVAPDLAPDQAMVLQMT